MFCHLNRPDACACSYIENAVGLDQWGEVQITTGEESSDMVFDVEAFEFLLKDRLSMIVSCKSWGVGP